jgi:hypothetical protein
MFGLKLPWQMKFTLRGVWLGGLMFVLGAILFASGRPTSLQRMLGLVMMFGALPFAVLVFVVSWLRRRSGLARQARSARRVVPGVGTVPRSSRRPAPERSGRAGRAGRAAAGSRR